MTEISKELADVDMDNFFSDEDEFTTELEVQEKTHKEEQDVVFLYRMFYDKLFPYKMYFHWLNYDTTPSKNFSHREFSFTLQSDIYLRFKSFQTGELLKKEIEKLQPIKIDIGAVYTIKPKDKKTVSEKAFRPIEKELVFDIDMTDYDEIRTCCSGGDICLLCWEFMKVAMEIIDKALREDFGFKHILWVYSGRRGVHCWVCDERARKLDNDNRKAIVNYLDIIKGGNSVSRKVNLPKILHPSLQRSLKVVEKYFKSLLIENMGILDSEERWSKLLSIINDREIHDKLSDKWKSNLKLTAEDKWNMLVKEDEKKKNHKFLRDIMLQYCYPRLDVKVSTNINHLLKSPFCVHPKTLKVCVPILPDQFNTFDPFKTPTLTQLSQELYEHDKLHPNDSNLSDYKKTSLKPYIEYFDKFIKRLLTETIQSKRDASEMSMEF